jgi:hypothetical protein
VHPGIWRDLLRFGQGHGTGYDLLRYAEYSAQGPRRHRTFSLITQGRYSVWFKTPVGEGAGVVEFGPNGKLGGGDTTFSYIGNWTQEGERFKAAISARRIAPGPPGVFGMDEIDIVVAGQSDGGVSASCTGFAKQSPGLKLEVVLIRI